MSDTKNSVARLQTEDVPRQHDPDFLVKTLENLGGSIKLFLEFWASERPYIDDDEIVLARIENWLSALEDKQFYRRWQTAIRQNRIVRLQLLQEKALERLENLTAKPENAENNLAWKMTEEVSFAKLVLGDLLAGQIHQAKQKPEEIADDQDDDDDADAEAAMNY